MKPRGARQPQTQPLFSFPPLSREDIKDWDRAWELTLHLHYDVIQRGWEEKFRIETAIALFTVSFSHLDYNVIQRGREAISDWNYKIVCNYLTYMLWYIVIQMKKKMTDTAKRAIACYTYVLQVRNMRWWMQEINYLCELIWKERSRVPLSQLHFKSVEDEN